MEINTREHCPVARSLDIVGDKWSILVIRNLALDGPHRFQDFANALPGISPTTLSARLKSLQENGIVKREVLNSHPPRTIYSLTKLGEEMKPVVRALRQFGGKLPPKS
ncbi:MAG: helix-turn-helix domain-containing protein [Pseudomonadota bacterium]